MSRHGIMLCYPFEEKRLLKWKPPYIVQPKYDGERCRAIPIGDGKYMLLSSQENPFFSVPHIVKDLSSLGIDVELDGELYCHGMSFEDIHSIVSRTVNIHPGFRDINYHIFDCIDEQSQLLRLGKLNNIIPFGWDRSLVRAPYYICNSLEDIMRTYERLIEAGYEGIIVRHLEAPYVRKRSIYMMKFKPKKEDVYELKGYSEELSIDGTFKGTLGRLICASEDKEVPWLGDYPAHSKLPDGYFGVGSGFTQEQRQDFWNGIDALPDKKVKVQYQHLTSGKGVPRFPVFLEVI